MLKISKLTDYALILLSEMHQQDVYSAQALSTKTKVPLATTNKILKKLAANHICYSKNGKHGGFGLNEPKNTISLLRVVNAIDDNGSNIIQCSSPHNVCQLQSHCKISKKMHFIDQKVQEVLSNYYISDLI